MNEIQPGTFVEVTKPEAFGAYEKFRAVLVGYVPDYRSGFVPRVMRVSDGRVMHGVPGAGEVLTVTDGTDLKDIALKALLESKAVFAKNPGFVTGCDPELFVTDTVGKVIPAFTFLPSKNDRGLSWAFWDGFQAEFATPAIACAANQMDNIREGLKSVLKRAKVVNPNAKLSCETVVEIPPEILAEASQTHVMLGCDPSENIYGLRGDPVPDARMLPFRFAGGHIHLGMDNPTQRMIRPHLGEMIRGMDIVAAVPSVAMFEGLENAIRRQYYGLPGEFRLPPHGVEYRTLSNAWMCHPAITMLMFDLVRAGAWVGANGLRMLFDASDDEVIQTVRGIDAVRARKIVERNKAAYAKILTEVYERAVLAWGAIEAGDGQNTKECVAAFFKVVNEGVGSVLEHPKDMASNWMVEAPHTSGGLKGVEYYFAHNTWTPHCESANRMWHKLAKTAVQGGKG